MQISVVSLLLFPGDSKRQAQAAVCWGLDWRQVDLLGKRPLFTGGKKNLGLPSNKWAGKEGREAASHFWAGFLAVLTHCDLKQFLFYPHPSVHPSRGAVTVLPPG